MKHSSKLTIKSALPYPIQKFSTNPPVSVCDQLAVEEPLEIRVGEKTVSITMRTPGQDFDLAYGFLYTEGIIRNKTDVLEIRSCGPVLNASQSQNIVRIELDPLVSVNLKVLERHFYTSSSCGVCGKTSIEALKVQSPYLNLAAQENLSFSAQDIIRMPDILRSAQNIFGQTGGLHASALFSVDGQLLLTREDVGRHNALDKVIGHALMNGLLPLSNVLLLVSGRASFELVQKAAMAGIRVLAAVGAPSSLAVDLAKESDMTLLGFLRNGRFNLYHGEWRVQDEAKNSR